MSMKLTEKIRNRILHIKDPFNIPAMIAVMDAAAKLFPNRSKNEAQIRLHDRGCVANGELGESVSYEPGLVNGRLNRSKILMGTAFFNEIKNIKPCDYEYIRDAGFDFLIAGVSEDALEKLLDECLKNNIAVIGGGFPGNPDIQSITENTVFDFSGYKSHPALAGNMGWDEPNASAFGAINTYTKAYHKALPGQFLFNNLFPDGTMKMFLGAKNYRDYINRWAESVEDDYISLDHYPFYSTSLINRIGLRIALNTYDCVADACRRTGRDFWIYTQTQGNWFAHLYLLVTYEQVKWQVYTALCYGARSIIQVSYVPVWGNDAYAMTDKDGNLTEQYLYAKRINGEVQKLSSVLSDYRSLGVVFSKAEKENRCFSSALKQQRKSNAEREFESIIEVLSVNSESTALIGFFENESGEKAIMIVNCRNLFDAEASQHITVELNNSYRVRVYQKGELVYDECCNSINLMLDSCDGVFITLDKNNLFSR